VVRDLVLKSGVSRVDVSDITGVLEGFTLDRPMSTRSALAPLALIYGFDMVERPNGLSFKSQDGAPDLNLSLEDLALTTIDAPAISRTKDDPEGRIVDVRLNYIDGARDHQTASLFARDVRAETVRVLDVDVPIVPQHAGLWQITRLDSTGSRGAVRRVTARAAENHGRTFPKSVVTPPISPPPIIWTPKPKIICLDMPGFGGAPRRPHSDARLSLREKRL